MSWREKRSGLLSSGSRGPCCIACQVSSILLNFEKLQFSLDDYCNEAWKRTFFPCVFVEECKVLTSHSKLYISWSSREICLTMFDHIPCKSLSMSEILLEHQISASFVRQDPGILRAQESYVSESVFTLHYSLRGFGFFQACESVSNSACAQVVPTIRQKVTEFRAQAYSASLIVYYWHFHARMKWCDVPKWRP